MTDHRGAASPRTEPGKRLLWFGGPMRPGETRNLQSSIAAIEAEAAQEAPAPEGLLRLVRELAEAYHLSGLVSDHADPNDKTGWNVHGIETCEDALCILALAAGGAER